MIVIGFGLFEFYIHCCQYISFSEKLEGAKCVAEVVVKMELGELRTHFKGNMNPIKIVG